MGPGGFAGGSGGPGGSMGAGGRGGKGGWGWSGNGGSNGSGGGSTGSGPGAARMALKSEGGAARGRGGLLLCISCRELECWARSAPAVSVAIRTCRQKKRMRPAGSIPAGASRCVQHFAPFQS